MGGKQGECGRDRGGGAVLAARRRSRRAMLGKGGALTNGRFAISKSRASDREGRGRQGQAKRCGGGGGARAGRLAHVVAAGQRVPRHMLGRNRSKRGTGRRPMTAWPACRNGGAATCGKAASTADGGVSSTHTIYIVCCASRRGRCPGDSVPAARHEHPVRALPAPLSRAPAAPTPCRDPAPRHPHIAATAPIPVTIGPDITASARRRRAAIAPQRRRRAVGALADRRRGRRRPAARRRITAGRGRLRVRAEGRAAGQDGRAAEGEGSKEVATLHRKAPGWRTGRPGWAAARHQGIAWLADQHYRRCNGCYGPCLSSRCHLGETAGKRFTPAAHRKMHQIEDVLSNFCRIGGVGREVVVVSLQPSSR